MTSWFKGILNRLIKPKLNSDSAYSVSKNGVVLAILDRPFIPDQFWVEFRLTPKTDSPSELATLYSQDFWSSDDLDIRELETGRRVKFLLSVDHDEVGQDVDFVPSRPLSKRPQAVTLRGPYL